MNRIENSPAAAAHGGVLVELPLEEAAPSFNLEKAVCSHGLFMMAPNQWDPQSKTLQRPLRLDNIDDHETSYMVQIYHPSHSSHALCIRVLGAESLSPQQQDNLLCQVRRMLRLSVEENMRVKEFQEGHEESKERGFGRVFRSPTLFEDMIKCILLCNCQWSRTLSMAQALCDLQLELQHQLPSAATSKDKNGYISEHQTTEMNRFIPKTPAGKESKRKFRVHNCTNKLAEEYLDNLLVKESNVGISNENISDCSSGEKNPILSSNVMDDFLQNCVSEQTSTDLQKGNTSSSDDLWFLAEAGVYPCTKTGNFPSPRELASLDEKFLAKRCNLGYRAVRIINLAREVSEGRIQLSEFEYAYGVPSLSDYDKLAEKLNAIYGFGPFTCANVLMCMGFYHVIPTDSETIRHLQQVHAKKSTIRTIQKDVETMYGKYAPYQFLVYWSEVWHFYEGWFGKLSEMPPSNYKLITAANMRPKAKTGQRNKRMKSSLNNKHHHFNETSET